MMNNSTLLITGGCGFIGSNLVRLALFFGYRVINIDALTYAGTLSTLEDVEQNQNYSFIRGDICDAGLLKSVFEEHKPSAVLHLAAESHVDRSIDSPETFIQTNIVGTFRLLESVRFHWYSLSARAQEAFRFLHVSTDEVFGSLGSEGYFNEQTPYSPRSPYSASKASSDHIVRAYFHTYGLPVIITNCSNNYGPYQYPEKLIPFIINSAIQQKALPVYGNGGNVRDWLYVKDHCNALLKALNHGKPGETYAIGGNCERTNLQVVYALCTFLDELVPRQDGKSYVEQITFVSDRPGHDHRYAIDASKIRVELGWSPQVNFNVGMRKTVQWYLENRKWVQRILDGEYRMERLGLKGRVDK